MNNTPINLGIKLALLSLASSGVMHSQQYEEANIIPSSIPEYLSLNTNDWEMDLPNLSNTVEYNDYIEYSIIQDFTSRLMENATDIDADILETTEEIFWDIL